MTRDQNLDLDLVIDEAIQDLLAGEPRRVTGPSVRAAALAESRRTFSGSSFLALAAAVVLLIGGVLFVRSPRPGSPVPSPGAPRAVATLRAESSEAIDHGLTSKSAARLGFARRPLSAQDSTDADYGVALLVVHGLTPPEPLRTQRLEPESIELAGLALTPLSIPTLSTEQEHR